MSYREGFLCSVCGQNVKLIWEFHYKIKSEIWLTVANSSEFLCIGCLEQRLGRYLIPNDFTRESINRITFGKKSARLQNRLQGRIPIKRKS